MIILRKTRIVKKPKKEFDFEVKQETLPQYFFE